MKKSIEQKRIGFHSIESIIKNNPHKIKKLFLPYSRDDNRINNLIEIANENNLNFKNLKEFIDNSNNQKLMILVLDNVIDPRNLGACIRSAAVTEVDALIINKHHCAPLNEVAHSVSAGGAENVKTFFVSNLVNCIKYLKEMNIQIFGLSEHASMKYIECDFVQHSAVIMGSEEFGIRKKTKENCDYLIKLNNNKNFKSFNVSVATGIILSEIARQRTC